MNDDLISRSELKKALDWIISNPYIELDIDREIMKTIDNAPTVDARPQGEWIPVSDRLPKERTSVLVWCPERKNIYCAHLENNQWWIFGAYSQKVEFEVIAWMSLPKPYKEEEK